MWGTDTVWNQAIQMIEIDTLTSHYLKSHQIANWHTYPKMFNILISRSQEWSLNLEWTVWVYHRHVKMSVILQFLHTYFFLMIKTMSMLDIISIYKRGKYGTGVKLLAENHATRTQISGVKIILFMFCNIFLRYFKNLEMQQENYHEHLHMHHLYSISDNLLALSLTYPSAHQTINFYACAILLFQHFIINISNIQNC